MGCTLPAWPRRQAAASPDAVTRRDTSWIWFDGRICQYHEARIGLLTHGLNYGTGVFEGIRAYWNAEREQLYTLRMPEHFDRMRANARVLQMEVPLATDELCAITNDLLRRNRYREDVYIRPIIFKSAEIIGVKLHDVPESFAICTAPMGNYVGTDGIRCMVELLAAHRRHHGAGAGQVHRPLRQQRAGQVRGAPERASTRRSC